MEYINNLGAIGKLSHKSNINAIRYIGYYFDEQLIDVNLYTNIYLMVNINDNIPSSINCLMINVKISFEKLYRIICDTSIKSIVFFKEMYVENIDTIVTCKNIQSIVCYNTVSANLIEKFFPNLRYLYMYRQKETSIDGNMNIITTKQNRYNFQYLEKLHIFSSGSSFNFIAPNLEELSIYVSLDSWEIDINDYPKLQNIRIDEKIILKNLTQRKSLQILQYYPSSNRNISEKTLVEKIDFTGMKITDLILPPTQKYLFKKQNVTKTLGVYVRDEDFLFNMLTNDLQSFQVYDNLYPLKICNVRFNNLFYKYFPFPDDITTELIERFNIQKQRENLIMLFNFDFMTNIQDTKDWQFWYNTCIETYHRLPIIIQHGQLMLRDNSNNIKEKRWPLLTNKTRRECIIFLPEEELLYINCSPMRLQTLIDKIKTYRTNKFTISKLWLITNGFELKTIDIEERVENLVIINNEIKMYITI